MTTAARGRQAVLPWAQAIGITVEGLRVRIGRAVITSASIVLATALVAHTIASHDLLLKLIGLNLPDVNFLLQQRGIDLENGTPGLQAREVWILSTALVVCLAGVCNALLMSVTERTREIGTMKCLGALDGSVIRLFLLEALLLGALSSALGAVFGLASAYVTAAVGYGRVLASAVTALGALRAVGGTAVLGTALSVLAAIPPALKAARMQPVDAMRTDI